MEHDLLVGRTVRVTTHRIVLGDTAYAVANLTSVRVVAESDRGKALLLGVLTAAVALLTLPGGGALLILAAVFLLFAALTKPRYQILLHSSGMETPAFKSTDKELVDKLLAAIHQAIASR